MEFNISIATLGHVDGICLINSLCFPIPWSRSAIENEIVNENSLYIVASINNQVIGYAGTWLILDEGHITNIAVHPNFRHLGIGSYLLKELMEECRIYGIHHMTLEVRASNTPAQSLYKKFGFINEGIRKSYYSDNGEDAIIMWKYDI